MNGKYHIIGIMSGTSLDGIDIVKCCFQEEDKWRYWIESPKTIPYTNSWKRKLQNLHQKSKSEIKDTDIKYGELLSKIILDYINKYNIKCDYIASHGHTIFHDPKIGSTLQIGDGQTIYNSTNITTINNFRELDILRGGQGAPLVPVGDLLLFPNYKYCLNLGGFANISIKNEKIIAFDICAVNFILNFLTRKINKDYDDKGEISRSGEINKNLFKELNSISFFNKPHPKSLSREWADKEIIPILEKYHIPLNNKLSTFCEHIAFQIGKFLKNNSVLVTGGGVHNKYLIERIKYYSKCKIIIPDNNIINFKEAIIFAFLGVLRITNKINCFSSVTGAKRDSSSGDIYKNNSS